MDKIFYTVVKISGDYAIMISDAGELPACENTVAMAFLPIEIAEGMRVVYENFEYKII